MSDSEQISEHTRPKHTEVCEIGELISPEILRGNLEPHFQALQRSLKEANMKDPNTKVFTMCFTGDGKYTYENTKTRSKGIAQWCIQHPEKLEEHPISEKKYVQGHAEVITYPALTYEKKGKYSIFVLLNRLHPNTVAFFICETYEAFLFINLAIKDLAVMVSFKGICGNCGQSGAKSCFCLATRFCANGKCSKEFWPIHKQSCLALQAFLTDEQRAKRKPSKSARRALEESQQGMAAGGRARSPTPEEELGMEALSLD